MKIPAVMGSFNSAPKIPNNDTQDNDLVIPQNLTNSALVEHCKGQRRNLPPLIPREFVKSTRNDNAITDGVRLSKLNLVSKACGQPITGPNSFRLLQWNILSQSLGQCNDGFVRCPVDALDWSSRKYNIVQGIVEYSPDIICLQEVDHFNFFRRVLATQGYEGVFFPKPDSPCLYIDGNNGPDGCAIFHRVSKFDLVRVDTRVLEVWRVKSNQVAIVAILRSKETGQEICVGTTHLKARSGALLAKLRDEQGKDLLDFVEKVAYEEDDTRPVILCGDFNAEPIEPIYRTVLNNTTLGLASAYANLEPGYETEHHTSQMREPPYTTWKIREDGEECHTIDYIFYSHRNMSVESTLQFPTEEEIGVNRLPSYTYPSDHFSLVCDFRIDNNNRNAD